MGKVLYHSIGLAALAACAAFVTHAPHALVGPCAPTADLGPLQRTQYAVEHQKQRIDGGGAGPPQLPHVSRSILGRAGADK